MGGEEVWPADKWIKETQHHVHSGILLSLKKGGAILTQATAEMNLEDIMLIEINQSEKDKYCMVPPTRGTQSSHIHKDRK